MNKLTNIVRNISQVNSDQTSQYADASGMTTRGYDGVTLTVPDGYRVKHDEERIAKGDLKATTEWTTLEGKGGKVGIHSLVYCCIIITPIRIFPSNFKIR